MDTVNAQTHRFGDCVAIYIGTDETVYLTPKDARMLSGAINKTARSIEREKFVDSPSGLTFELEAPDGRRVDFVRKAPPVTASDLAIRNQVRLNRGLDVTYD